MRYSPGMGSLLGFGPGEQQGQKGAVAFMRPIALSDEIAVGEVPLTNEIQILATAGFRSVINAQPDGEVARFANAATTRQAAEAAGLTYAHVPIDSRRPSQARINDFAGALANLPRPIYAYCYSGSRAAAAWALALAPQLAPAKIVQALELAGFDAGTLAPALNRRHAGLPPYEELPVGATALISSTGQAASTDMQPAPPVPLPPTIIVLPRAASVGGFSVPG
jgi:uncharacterized protein (TIGR01244 family)